MFFRSVKPQGIIVVVEQERHLELLLHRGYRLVARRSEQLSIL